jgi:hypothetical protein
MSEDLLARCLFIAGLGQLSVLVASALVPIRLEWRTIFVSLPKLHRQMYWVYGGYIVLSIVAFGVISLGNANELAHGSQLARFFCGYVAIFWGVRVCLQPVLDVKEFLTAWWLRLGYHTLTVLFLYFTGIFAWAALH